MMDKYKTMIEDLGQNKRLCLSDSNIGEDDVKSLAEALKSTQIIELDLSNTKIGCNGLKCLADVLKDTQMNKLNLRNTNLQDEGVKYLAYVLNNTKIEYLDLTENKIGFQTAEHLNMMVSCTTVNKLYFDIYSAGNCNKYISQSSNCQFDDVCITLRGSNIGLAGSKYINNSFRKLGIKEVQFRFQRFDWNHLDYFFQAFKNIKIDKLCLSRSDNVKYLNQIFEKSQIGQLDLHYSKLRDYNINYLAEFLRTIKILDLDISSNHLEDNSIRILAPALKNSDIMKLNLAKSKITCEGVKYLSEVLRDTKIAYISLCNCKIGTAGARELANGLPHSQVTNVHIHGNMIGYAGYQALLDVVNDTNISWVNLHHNDIEKENGHFNPHKLPRKTTTIAYNIERAFETFVSLNLNSDEFEFIVPTKCAMRINGYAFLIGMLKNKPNSKVHIIYNSMFKHTYNHVYDFALIKKIDEFIADITDKFISFIGNKLPDLLIKFVTGDFVKLVKLFEKFKLYDIVQHLLLHRVLYYVDENQEILHPHIYKLLSRYNLPTYNSELEPNKKNEIISYYESHQEIDGAQEMVDLLKSNSL